MRKKKNALCLPTFLFHHLVGAFGLMVLNLGVRGPQSDSQNFFPRLQVETNKTYFPLNIIKGLEAYLISINCPVSKKLR